MKRAVLFVAIFFAPFIAYAETISWALPTQYADGSAIQAGALKETVIEIGSCTGTAPNFTFGAVQTTLRAADPATSIAWLPTKGTYCLRARAVTDDGEASANSAMLRFVKTSPKPKAITISITATVP